MQSAAGEYGRVELVNALTACGLGAGDTVFVQVNLDALGTPRGEATSSNATELVLGALRDVVGPGGTILVPTYTFSFCRGDVFDVEQTPTRGGPWSPSADFLEYFRRLPGVQRSRDPIHSVAGQGPAATRLLDAVAPTCFGADSVFERLLLAGGKICMIGVGLDEATSRHHAEEVAGSPFRFRKLFTGYIRDRGLLRKHGWIYNVRWLADNAFPDGRRLDQLARSRRIARSAPVGGGEVVAVEVGAFHRLTLEALAADPWFTARGPAGDPVALEDARVGACRPSVALSPDASAGEMIDALWRLPRDIVSDGYDAALGVLADQVPMTVHEYPSGRECWSWIVPEKWTCHEAYIERLNGERLVSYLDNPLHVVSYSLPFDGVVSREVLLQHLHVHPRQPDAIPFVFKYYERDWGLCCAQRVRDALHDPAYRVVIRSEFSFGHLKVGEVVARGRTDDCIVLCAHLCHPAMVNDDLSGVVVGIDAMRALLARRDLRYTYRFLIVPETIGSLAYLSANEALIPSMRGGIFLEMLGRDHPHALQLSFGGDTAMDRAFSAGLRRADPDAWTTPYRTLMGNDERQFNAPGVRVPMVSLTRMLPPSHPDHPYAEYHSSADTPDRVPPGRLEESRDAVLAMVEELERQEIPVSRYRGEVFCSRYGAHIDAYTNPEGNRALFRIMDLVDGTRTMGDIASSCGISEGAVRATLKEMRGHGLVSF